jgi:hypothetical protein
MDSRFFQNMNGVEFECISRPKFKVKGLKGFEDYVFTESSKILNVLEALLWPETRGTVPVSAYEATGVCIAAKGADSADTAQITRTGIVYYKDGQTYFMAINDSPDPEKNIVIAQAHKLLTPELVKEHIRRAERTGRIAEVPEQSPIELSLTNEPGFAQNPSIRGLLLDMAEPRAADLRKRHGREKTYLHTLTVEELKKLGIEGDKTEICIAILDVDNKYNSGGIDARCKYNTKEKFGCTRGIYNARST